MSLVDMQRGAPRHVPYRDSRLTYLLQVLHIASCWVLIPLWPVLTTLKAVVGTLELSTFAKFRARGCAALL